MSSQILVRCVSAALGVAALTSVAHAYDPTLLQYFIARDGQRIIPSGVYAGLPNPNFNRITFLYAHSFPDRPEINHFHSKSRFTYFGPNLGANTAIQPFVGNPAGQPTFNYLPEGGTAANPARLQLLPGTGVFEGSWITGPAFAAALTPTDFDFGLTTIASIDSLDGNPPGSPAHWMFNSSGRRWTGSMAGTNLQLQLHAITPGLTIADTSGNTLLSSPGDFVSMGSGDITLSFTPVFRVLSSNPANYSATFRIVDVGTANDGNPFPESGFFIFHVTVPEPAALGLLLPAAALLLRRR